MLKNSYLINATTNILYYVENRHLHESVFIENVVNKVARHTVGQKTNGHMSSGIRFFIFCPNSQNKLLQSLRDIKVVFSCNFVQQLHCNTCNI